MQKKLLIVLSIFTAVLFLPVQKNSVMKAVQVLVAMQLEL